MTMRLEYTLLIEMGKYRITCKSKRFGVSSSINNKHGKAGFPIRLPRYIVHPIKFSVSTEILASSCH